MAQKNSTVAADEHAISFFGLAEQYQKAGDLVHASGPALSIPTYFLYMHAIELALKAHLRAANLPIVTDRKRKHHQIIDLYEECRALGLTIGPDDRIDLRNVVALLQGANEEQGLRYGTSESQNFPELDWTKDVVENLLKAVEPSVMKKVEADGIALGQPVKVNMTFSKPTRRR
jgi:hypothetical protein